MTLTPKEIAQELADTVQPPYTDVRRRTDLPYKELMKLDSESRYASVLIRSDHNSTPWVVFTAPDGYPATRALTYLEIIEHLLTKFDITPKDSSDDRSR